MFCRLTLTDARSTAVGYGQTCAGHWGMPWGEARLDAEPALEEAHAEAQKLTVSYGSTVVARVPGPSDGKAAQAAMQRARLGIVTPQVAPIAGSAPLGLATLALDLESA
jgi:hypothetical protein